MEEEISLLIFQRYNKKFDNLKFVESLEYLPALVDRSEFIVRFSTELLIPMSKTLDISVKLEDEYDNTTDSDIDNEVRAMFGFKYTY